MLGVVGPVFFKLSVAGFLSSQARRRRFDLGRSFCFFMLALTVTSHEHDVVVDDVDVDADDNCDYYYYYGVHFCFGYYCLYS